MRDFKTGRTKERNLTSWSERGYGGGGAEFVVSRFIPTTYVKSFSNANLKIIQKEWRTDLDDADKYYIMVVDS